MRNLQYMEDYRNDDEMDMSDDEDQAQKNKRAKFDNQSLQVSLLC